MSRKQLIEQAATHIQAFWRGYKCREVFKNILISKLLIEADQLYEQEVEQFNSDLQNSQRKQSLQIQTPQLGEPADYEDLPLKLSTIDPDLPMGFK